MTKKLADKVVLVTGAARGMGLEHARLCLEEGAKVILTDLADINVADIPPAFSSYALRLKLDVTDDGDWKRVIAIAEDKFGPLNVLVNNAGVIRYSPILECSLADYHLMTNVNQLGVFLGIKAAIGPMRRVGGGSIINVSSAAGMVGVGGYVAYCGSKFAVRGMTKAAAIELGPYGIRVNSIHPGAVRTPMLTGGERFQEFESHAKTLPLGRLAAANEISPLVLFLASNDSGYCTGAEFVVDGGYTCGP